MNLFQSSILIGSLLIVFFAFFIIYGLQSFKKENKTKFNFKNMFPFELYLSKRNNVVYLILLIVYSSISFTCFIPLIYLCLTYESGNTFMWLIVVIDLLFVIAQTAFIALNIVSASYVKPHAILSTCFFSFSLLTTAILSVALYDLYQLTLANYYIVLMVVGIIVALCDAVIIINPKLKYWAKLEKVINEDGSISYVRPKHFVLAISQWLVFILNFITAILPIIATIIYSSVN